MFALDYTRDGRKFVVAGRDSKLYVYDENTRELSAEMHHRGLKVPGHRSRVHSVKSHPDDENIVASAGWDGCVKLYDIRDKAPIGSMRGAQVGGDAIDIFEDLVVSGSNRN